MIICLQSNPQSSLLSEASQVYSSRYLLNKTNLGSVNEKTLLQVQHYNQQHDKGCILCLPLEHPAPSRTLREYIILPPEIVDHSKYTKFSL